MRTYDEIRQIIDAFVDERQWRPYHTPKNLALSISIEAAELLEIFQWVSSDEAVDTQLEHIKEELADVLIYAHMLASTLDLDIPTIIQDKMIKNAIKYPLPETGK
ncbi:MAG: nucleotide pyrophosphohydrolase [Aerococcaceae bacterium]|nr:nucleotide pyrophosphohydrolase [Aerococcaceae bacterium]